MPDDQQAKQPVDNTSFSNTPTDQTNQPANDWSAQPSPVEPYESPAQDSPSAPTQSQQPVAAPGEVEPSTGSTANGTTAWPAASTGFSGQEQPKSDIPVASAPAMATIPANDNAGGAQKKSKKKLLIGAIVVGVLALLVGASAAGYNLWYQNPDKVIGDALANALTASSSSTESKLKVVSSSSSSPMDMTLTMDTLANGNDARADLSFTNTSGGKTYSMSGSLLSKNNEKFFVKVDKLKETLEQSGLMMYVGSSASVTSLIEKLDGSWVVISNKDIEEFSDSKDDSSECVETAIKKLQTDSVYSNELSELYRKYPVIGVKNKLGSENGSLGYEIEFLRENAIKFADGVNDTKFFADVKKCDDKIEDLNGKELFKEDEADSRSKSTVKLWIDRWSHQMTKLEVTGEAEGSKGTFSLVTNMKFDVPVSVDEPKNPITIDELKADIEAIQQELAQQQEASMQESMRLSEEMNNKGTWRMSDSSEI